MKKVFIITFIVLLIDQLSKIYIKTHFYYGEDVSVIGDWFYLSFIENPGMAYGMNWGGLSGKIMLTLLRWGLIGGIVYYILQKKELHSNYFLIPMGLILAGALGNVLDSTFYGILFDSGTTWNESLEGWQHGYAGISQMNFEGYAGWFQGCVVDMLYFPLFDYKIPDSIPILGGKEGTFFSPVFNVADTAISIGGALILLFRKKAFTPQVQSK